MDTRTLCFGVDVHRDQLVLRAADKATGREVGALLRVPNNRLGAEQAVTWLLHLATGTNDVRYAHLEGGLEATGLLWLPFHVYLTEQAALRPFHLQLICFNPKLIADFKKGIVLADDKDDGRDAWGIVERVRFGHWPTSYVPDDFWQGLRRLTRYRFHLAQTVARESTRFGTHVFLKWSDWQRLAPFSDLLGVTSATLLTQYSTADLNGRSLSQLTDWIDQLGKRRFSDPQATARKVQQALVQSYPVAPQLEQAVMTVLSIQLEHIRLCEKLLKRLDHDIAQYIKDLPNPLLSMRGLGPVITAGILAEIAKIKRFPGDPQLAKYAGLVWRKHASADFVAQDTRLSKVGNVYLRYYLIQGANLLRQYNLDYQAYYRRKAEEAPKHKHKRALVLTARKLVRLVHALLTKNQPFVARSTATDTPEATDTSPAA
jgi:transposase